MAESGAEWVWLGCRTQPIFSFVFFCGLRFLFARLSPGRSDALVRLHRRRARPRRVRPRRHGRVGCARMSLSVQQPEPSGPHVGCGRFGRFGWVGAAGLGRLRSLAGLCSLAGQADVRRSSLGALVRIGSLVCSSGDAMGLLHSAGLCLLTCSSVG